MLILHPRRRYDAGFMLLCALPSLRQTNCHERNLRVHGRFPQFADSGARGFGRVQWRSRQVSRRFERLRQWNQVLALQCIVVRCCVRQNIFEWREWRGNLCLATAMRLNQAGKMHLVSAWHRLGSCCRCGFIHSTCHSGARDLRFVPLRRRELPQREIPQHGDQQRDFAAARRPWPTFVRGLLMLATQFCVSCN